MKKQNEEITCNNVLVIKQPNGQPDYHVCRLVKSRSGILGGCYLPCIATPFVFESVGHCTGDPYGTIWFGEGEFQEGPAQKCPGYNNLQVTKKDLMNFQSQVSEKGRKWLKKEYQQRGINRKVT